ncbi:MAG: carboxy-S-adenosyl-L-methionine synthase CmoA [Cellvibrionaceae bacterium]
MSTYKDTLFAETLDTVARFTFDEHVVKVFPDMIQRSVPGYEAIIKMIGEMSERYAQNASNCYDLGCSLGAASLAMQQSINAKDCRIIGIDNSEAMLNNFSSLLSEQPKNQRKIPIELVHADIQHAPMSNASVVVLNFTLQFIPLSDRNELIQKIYNSLLPGGILIMSEKVCFEDEAHQNLMTELHHNFKRANGYSDLEIAQKRSAIDNVLIPETLEAHRERFRSAGFLSQDVWFQCFNFASMIAIK